MFIVANYQKTIMMEGEGETANYLLIGNKTMSSVYVITLCGEFTRSSHYLDLRNVFPDARDTKQSSITKHMSLCRHCYNEPGIAKLPVADNLTHKHI